MEHFIYALKDKNSDLPFYVGKSINPPRRKKKHIYDAKTCSLDYPVHRKIRKLLREDLGIELSILESGLSEDNVDDKEVYWISYYREKTKLFNVSNGGEGGKGITQETIEKIRKKHLGSKRSKETCQRISEANKGRVFSDEHKQKLSKSRKKRITTEDTKNKMSQSSLGKINIKKYKMISPCGKEFITENGLSDFCRQHDLSPGNMVNVLNKKRNHHKGWRIENADH